MFPGSGFGGTNSHAIIGHFAAPFPGRTPNKQGSSVPVLPLVQSANSETALRATMESLVSFLKREPDVQIQDLARTLWQKRWVLSTRRALVAQTKPAACLALEAAIASIANKESPVATGGIQRSPQIIGVFTGRGAQWPAMGKALVTCIPQASDVVEQLDEVLQTLPASYRPS